MPLNAAQTEARCAKAPEHRWRIGRLRFGLYTSGPQAWRWEVSDGSRGVHGYRTPWTAYRALLRWREVPARPSC